MAERVHLVDPLVDTLHVLLGILVRQDTLVGQLVYGAPFVTQQHTDRLLGERMVICAWELLRQLLNHFVHLVYVLRNLLFQLGQQAFLFFGNQVR